MWSLFSVCMKHRVGPAPTEPEHSKDILGSASENVTNVRLELNGSGKEKITVDYQEDFKHIISLIPTDNELHMRDFQYTSQSKHTSNFYYDQNRAGVRQFFLPPEHDGIFRVDTVVFNDPARSIGQTLCNYLPLLSAHTVSLKKSKVTAEELEFIRANFQRIEKFRVSSDLPQGLMNFPLRYPDVKMLDGHEITKDVLKGITCKKLEVHHTYLKASDLKDLVLLWSRGECWMNLQSLVIRRVEGDISLNQILRGYTTYTWNKDHPRGKYFVQDDNIVFDCAEETDIKRFRDGQVATVILHKNTFRFYVWQKLFPNIPKNKFTLLNRHSSSFMEF